MNIVAIIPARMTSSRFPGKPMAPILGIPMLGHVYFRTIMSRSPKATYVATCDKEIYDYTTSIGGRAVMTSDKHERASDRVSEALMKIEAERNEKTDIVVMVQGDEPMVHPEMIDDAIKPMLADPSIQVVNLMGRLEEVKEQEDPNEIKVVVDKNNFALYFSRAPIPSRKKWKGDHLTAYKQVCIIPFRRDFLLKFGELEMTPLESIESIDMLRVLEYGIKVKMVLTNHQTYSVDTPEDLKYVEEMLKKDPLVPLYAARSKTGKEA